MSVTVGDIVTVPVEKPAAGGWMIARIDGQVLLVSGAIPGERVRAAVRRVGRGVAYAETLEVEEASGDRRPPFTDAACGGCAYAHIAYPRQLSIKSTVILDAFARIGRIDLPAPPAVRASPEEGYRMRARLHVRGARIGFFREGTHELCDVGSTKQLLPETVELLTRLSAALRSVRLESVREIDLSENLDATERAIALTTAGLIPLRLAEAVASIEGLTGTLVGRSDSPAVRTVGGSPYVTDRLSVQGREVRLRRHVLAFFQGNRYLLGPLVDRVLDVVEPGSRIVDLYSGAGLFAVTAAIARDAHVTAVEGDRMSAADLEANAASVAGVTILHQPVESFRNSTSPLATAIVDPPRTGMSRDALSNIIGLAPRQLVYVSCDVATLARDARKILDAGYRLREIDGFDLFPNTPHVETVAIFEIDPRS